MSSDVKRKCETISANIQEKEYGNYIFHLNPIRNESLEMENAKAMENHRFDFKIAFVEFCITQKEYAKKTNLRTFCLLETR